MDTLNGPETHWSSFYEFRTYWDDFLTFETSNLEEIYLKYAPTLSNVDMTKMLNSHPTIKSLSIIDCPNISSKFFGAIGQLKDLEKLEFQQNWKRSEEMFHQELNYLASLENFKVLKLNCNKYFVSNLLAKLVGKSLWHLELANAPIDSETFRHITKLTSLTVLKFNEMTDVTDSHIWGIGKELKLLNKIQIKTNEIMSKYTTNALVGVAHRLTCLKIDIPSFILTESVYNTLLSHVQNRADHTSLELTIYSNEKQVQVSPELLMGPNKKWLRIEEFNRDPFCELFPHNATMENNDLTDFLDDDEDDDDEDDDDDGSIDLDDFDDFYNDDEFIQGSSSSSSDEEE